MIFNMNSLNWVCIELLTNMWANCDTSLSVLSSLLVIQFLHVFSVTYSGASQVALVVKNPPASAGDIRDTGSIPGLGRKDMVIHSSILAWRITWTEESGRLQSMGSHRVRHDWSDFVLTYYSELIVKNWISIVYVRPVLSISMHYHT